uniref:Solute carrier family 25 member 44 n=1 Tax=Ascaris suum TaxID=6253 RepID=F1L6P2_ASCSU
MASTDADHDFGENRQLHIIEWEHLDLYKFYPLAMASSWSIRCLLYPMSVVKSRLQLQKQNTVYRGMRHAFIHILRNEGFTALYRGFWMTLPQLSASFLYSGAYEKIRDLLQAHAGLSSAAILSALAGAAASATTQLIFVPTDIIAQHMMVHNNPDSFIGSMRNAAVINFVKEDPLGKRLTLGLRVTRAVYCVDGFKGFYRGFLSSIMLYIPSSMVFWVTYYNVLDLFKALRRHVIYPALTTLSEDGQLSQAYVEKHHYRNIFVDQALAGSLSGMSAAICTNPLEVLRIRVQVHRTSYAETIRRLMKYEGTRVFTKGLPPRIINNGIYSCLIMLGYETVKKLCVLPQFRDHIVW